MDIFRFRNFPVYLLVREFRKKVKVWSKEKLPKEEKFCLRNQLWRALDSIALNIAEGSDHYSDIEFGKYLNTSLTSLNEVVACLNLAFDDSYLSESELNHFVSQAEEIAKQLKAFSSKLRSNKV